ncbi:MAG: DUF4388 domain-containing protein [Anaerolineae bacterium]|nr:DUF4388 domain-containing protein [Anaerolineae bacterium]
MALKGDLRDFSTTQLLNLIKLARKTGTLTVESREGQSCLLFREGKLIYATSDGQDDRLVPVLRSVGKLSAEEAKIIQRQGGDRTDRELGVLLINAGRLSRKDVEDAVRLHMMNSVHRLFAWSEGSFRFDANYLPVKNRITVSVDLESVIVEGSRRIEEWERLQDELPDLDRALKFTDSPGTDVRNISLNVQEWRIISYVNPRNTIRQIAQYHNMSDFQIRKIADGLLQAGLVEMLPVAVPVETQPAATKEEAAVTPPVNVLRPAVKRSLIMRLIDRIREL